MLDKTQAATIVRNQYTVLTSAQVAAIYQINPKTVIRVIKPSFVLNNGHARYKALDVPHLIELAHLALKYDCDLKVLSSRQVADMLEKSVDYVRTLVRAGELKPIATILKRGSRFLGVDVDAFLAKKRP